MLGTAASPVRRVGIFSEGVISNFHSGGNAYLLGTGIGYRYNDFLDGVIYQAWNRVGDGNSAYWNEINVYSFSLSDYDYFNYNGYRSMQLSRGGAVPICFSTRLGCPWVSYEKSTFPYFCALLYMYFILYNIAF